MQRIHAPFDEPALAQIDWEIKTARVHFIPDLKGRGIRDPPRSLYNKN
jgi:hypothetical protein